MHSSNKLYMIVTISLSLPCCMALAGGPDNHSPQPNDTGFYLGGGGGAGWSTTKTTSFTEVDAGVSSVGTSKIINGSGFAARIMGGYQFQYFALESSFTYVPEYTENDIGTASIGAINIKYNSKDRAHLMYASFLGKVSYPCSFARFFAGGGLAVVFKDAQTRHTNLFNASGTFIGKRKESGAHATFARPEITVGANRHLSEHVLMQLDYSRVFEKNNIGVKKC